MTAAFARISKRAAALFCAFAVFMSCFCLSGVQPAEAKTAKEAMQRVQELQQELINANKEIAKAKDDIEEAQQRAATYTVRVNAVSEQISILQELVDAKKEELRIKQEELDEKEREHDTTYELFKKRLRAMYMNNNVTLLSLILGSNTFSEFLVAAEMQSRVSKHDT